MLDDNHLHIDKNDQLSNGLSKALRAVTDGEITISCANEPVAKITANNTNIAVDLFHPDFFKIPEDNTGLFDKLKTASEFGHTLSENGITISFLRRGKEAIRLGKDAKPTLSRLVTRSDDIQVNSMREFAKLKGDLKAD